MREGLPMVSRSTKIINRTGLHARPASMFVVEAKKFKSSVKIAHVNGREANAKSIMMVLAGGFNAGDSVVITCDGPDENEALESMIKLLDSGCGDTIIL